MRVAAGGHFSLYIHFLNEAESEFGLASDSANAVRIL